MKTEEQVRELYEKFKKDNPIEWVIRAGLKPWYDGYEQAIKEILDD